ncbi:MAG TPA: tetratricopeptide repeat protein [Thermoanaerobaculia bacterium]|jgi:tetratricopeptide (TPR) repeat protein
MAQATTPKIEELRFRIKTDPKSRLFFPLAEELRKVSALSEAEAVLRAGLEHHPTYLSAWVSLGRVLREEKNDPAAIAALTKALQLDPGNVVAARLLADAYLAQGEKLEALKKYKLVHALMPSDEELQGLIIRMEREVNPPQVAVAEPEPEPEPAREAAGAPPQSAEEESPWADAASSLLDEHRVEEATADDEPMSVAHEESPFEESAQPFTTAAFEVEAPEGMHVGRAPMEAEVPLDMTAEIPMIDAPAMAPEPSPPHEDITSTLTMADLYAKQGLVADARQIYETILLRDPDNETVRAKVAALEAGSGSHPKVKKLEAWLAKVGRREVSHV